MQMNQEKSSNRANDLTSISNNKMILLLLPLLQRSDMLHFSSQISRERLG